MASRARAKKYKAWYQDKQNLALVTGFISTGLTILNMYLGTF